MVADTYPSWKCFGILCGRTTACKSCHRAHSNMEWERELSLNFPTGHHVSVKAALAQTLATELLEKSACSNCGSVARSRSVDVLRWPRALILVVKRWSTGAAGRRRVKDCRHIAFEEVLQPPGHDAPMYALRSVIEHVGGSLEGGHYITWNRADSGTWFRCDDAHTQEVPWANVQRSQAYVLMYETIC